MDCVRQIFPLVVTTVVPAPFPFGCVTFLNAHLQCRTTAGQSIQQEVLLKASTTSMAWRTSAMQAIARLFHNNISLWHWFGRTGSPCLRLCDNDVITRQQQRFFWHHPITKVSSADSSSALVQWSKMWQMVGQRLGRFFFCLLIVLCFSKCVYYKNWLCQEWGGIPNCKMGTKHHLRIFPSVTSKGLHFYAELTAHKIFKSEKVQTVFAFEQKHDVKKTASRLRRWICFILQSKTWLYTKRDRMCPDMLCVWVPLFITSNTSSAHCQYSASSRCSSTVWLPPVLSAQEPQPVIYYLAVFCLTWVHTAGHTVALSQAVVPFVILCKAVPMRWYLLICQRTL